MFALIWCITTIWKTLKYKKKTVQDKNNKHKTNNWQKNVQQTLNIKPLSTIDVVILACFTNLVKCIHADWFTKLVMRQRGATRVGYGVIIAEGLQLSHNSATRGSRFPLLLSALCGLL